MKEITLLLLIMALLVISGCAKSPALIKASSTSVRSDVFQELKKGGPIPQGYADLRITSSLKTHKPGIYPFEKTKSHGTTDYMLLLNIDGQALQIKGAVSEENFEPRTLRDPEAGDGIRYRLQKKVRLESGAHRLVVAIPNDGIAVEREINLVEGSNNSLVLEPLYGLVIGKQRPGFYGVTSFYQGIKGFRVNLNGKTL
jgi:hypothetical protein